MQPLWLAIFLLVVAIGALVVATQRRMWRVAVIGVLILGLAVLTLAWRYVGPFQSPAPAPSHPLPSGRSTPDLPSAKPPGTSASSPAVASTAARHGATSPTLAGSGTGPRATISGPIISRKAPDSVDAKPPVLAGPAEDIYLVLDTSPSMLIPTSFDGMKALAAGTAGHLGNGCAFACHERTPFQGSAAQDRDRHIIFVDPSGKRLPSKSTMEQYSQCLYALPCFDKPDGPRVADGFWLARNYGAVYGGQNIELRIDTETAAVRQLVDRLHQRGGDRLQVFGFGLGDPVALMGALKPVSTVLPAAVPDLAALQPEWYSNNCLTKESCNDDQATDFAAMFRGLESAMTAPSNNSVASDRARLMVLVTDGMSDEAVKNGRWVGPLTPDHLAQCAAIKRRGIRIAILYLEYAHEAFAGDYWAENVVTPHLSEVEPVLAQCASIAADGKSLFRKVSVGGDIPAGLSDLVMTALSDPATK